MRNKREAGHGAPLFFWFAHVDGLRYSDLHELIRRLLPIVVILVVRVFVVLPQGPPS